MYPVSYLQGSRQAAYTLLNHMHIACHSLASLSDDTWRCYIAMHPRSRCISMMQLKASRCGGPWMKISPQGHFVTREAPLHTDEMRRHDQHLLHTPIKVQAHKCFGGKDYGHQIWRTNCSLRTLWGLAANIELCALDSSIATSDGTYLDRCLQRRRHVSRRACIVELSTTA